MAAHSSVSSSSSSSLSHWLDRDHHDDEDSDDAAAATATSSVEMKTNIDGGITATITKAALRRHRRLNTERHRLPSDPSRVYSGRRGGLTCDGAPWAESVHIWRKMIEKAMGRGYTAKVKRMLKRCKDPSSMIDEVFANISS